MICFESEVLKVSFAKVLIRVPRLTSSLTLATAKTMDTVTTTKPADALAAAKAAATGKANARPVEQFDKEFQRYVTKHVRVARGHWTALLAF
jgi:hypothetical protein